MYVYIYIHIYIYIYVYIYIYIYIHMYVFIHLAMEDSWHLKRFSDLQLETESKSCERARRPSQLINIGPPNNGPLMSKACCHHRHFQDQLQVGWAPMIYGNDGKIDIAFGKQPHSHGKSSFLMGKLSISTGPFSIAMSNCQRVVPRRPTNTNNENLLQFQGCVAEGER